MLLASISGVTLSLVVAVITGLDNRLVAAYRAGRSWPYRATFFVMLFGLTVAVMHWAQRPGRRQSTGRAVPLGALLGYASGFAAWWIVQVLFISAGGAWIALRDFPRGMHAPLVVPLATLSWVFGAVAFVATHLILRARTAFGE